MNTAEAGRDFIEHYGVKGMRWGVRKERSSPVTTESTINRGLGRKTKVKAKGGKGQSATPDAVKAAQTKQILKKSGPAALSNQQLRELNTRLQLEQQAQQLAGSPAKKFISKQLKTQGEQTVQREASRAVGEARKRRRGD